MGGRWTVFSCRTGSLWPSAGTAMRGMVREYTGGNSRGPGWREFAGPSVVRWVARSPTAPSGREWNGSQSGQGATELGFPRPALGKMQGEAAGRAGDSSGEGEEPPPEGLGGHHLLTQTGPGCPTGQVMRHHLYRQPSGVGGETARRHVVQPHAVLQVSNGVLDLGMAAVSIARVYRPVVARVIEPPCGPVDGLLSPLGLRVNHLLSVEQGPVG